MILRRASYNVKPLEFRNLQAVDFLKISLKNRMLADFTFLVFTLYDDRHTEKSFRGSNIVHNFGPF